MILFHWPKTKLQNIGSGPKPLDISVDGNRPIVESVNSFVYLGSLSIIRWSMSSRPYTPNRPFLCSHDVSKTDMERQPPDTGHQAPYMYTRHLFCLCYYAADTWTLLSADVWTLDAFHQKCLRQLLGIRWYNRV